MHRKITTRRYDNAPFSTSQIFILEYKLILILFSFKNEYVEGVIAGAMKVVVQGYCGYCDRNKQGDWVCYGTPYGTTGIDCDFNY